MIVGGLGAYVTRHQLIDWYRARQAEPVPTAVNVNAFDIGPQNTISGTAVETAAETIIDTSKTDEASNNKTTTTTAVNEGASEIVPPAELNLAVPFTAQAPHANWDLPYQEACEEASVLMAARFLQGRTITDATDANSAIVELVNYNVEQLGQPIDTTAEQTAGMVESFYGLDTEVLYDWTWDDVKQALAQGYPVILPAAGRELGNPNFTAPGPVYHMLVIKGYTDTVIITNDPGTRKGADYQYRYETLAKANHDWNGGDVANGKKVIIIIKPNNEN